MKHKKAIIIGVVLLAISFIFIALSNSTYALFSNDAYGANTNQYTTGMLSIEASSKSENITLDNVLPMSDEEGLKTNPYVFIIKNIGNLDYLFDVKLLSTGDSSTSFSSQYIKLQIDEGEVITLSDLSNGEIKSDITLLAGDSIDISVRVWLSIETPNSEIGKSFNSKIVTDGQAVYTSSNNELNINAAQFITSLYNGDEKTEVTNNGITYHQAQSVSLMNDRLGGTTEGYDSGNIRYYGASPNNYVYFNCSDYHNQNDDTCELWRIIGVFDGKVKIMRNSMFTENLAWDQNKNNLNGTSTDTSYNNDWSNSSLQEFLNGKYYDRGTDQTWTYYTGSSGSSSVSINLENIGIKNDETRRLISETLWYLKGWNTNSIYADQMYDYERNSGSVAITGQPTTMLGNIAVPYVSDYGYAVDFGSCVSKPLSSYNAATCTSTNWMRPILGTSSYGWLMAPYSSYSLNAWIVYSSGSVYVNDRVSYARGVAPVLHLNSELGIEAGDGSQDSPYKLAVS